MASCNKKKTTYICSEIFNKCNNKKCYAITYKHWHKWGKYSYDKTLQSEKLFQNFKGYPKNTTNIELIDLLRNKVSPEMADAFRNF